VRRALLASVLLVPALAACRNERAESLQAELAKLKDERVETASIDKARQEADAEQAALTARKSDLEAARAELASAEAERDAARKAIDAESARNAALQAQNAEIVHGAQAAAARGQELDTDLGRVRARAAAVRDQAAVLAREIRPEDPAWATSRRLAALAEFSERLAKEYPGDPDVVALARAPIRAEKPTRDEALAASARAAALRDRFEAAYELPPAGPSAAAAPDGTAPVATEPAP
jgi:DNA repair exonuclease SbcCD ATPase subunit